MADRRRVCFVLPSLNGGGAERAAVQVLNGLDPVKWDRSMFLFERRGPYLRDVDQSIALHASPAPTRLQRWRALRRFVRETQPHVVMAFLSYATALSAARAANVSAKVIFNQQTPMSDFLTDADYQWRRHWHKTVFTSVTRFAFGLADMIVVTSNGVARDLTERFGVGPDSIRVLANPLDLGGVRRAAAEPLDAALLPRGDGPLVIAAGRLAEAKNYPLLIDAFALVTQRMPARLCILGQGELEPSLRQHISDRELSGAVTLAGFQGNPWKFMARADVFALTSRYEGFGNVLIEAMACGVPVVATASAGTRDIVAHGVNGLLVENHTPASVAGALLTVLSNHAMRAALASAAAASAENYDLPIAIDRYDATLREVLA